MLAWAPSSLFGIISHEAPTTDLTPTERKAKRLFPRCKAHAQNKKANNRENKKKGANGMASN